MRMCQVCAHLTKRSITLVRANFPAIGGTDLDDDLQKAIRMSMMDAQESGTIGKR